MNIYGSYGNRGTKETNGVVILIAKSVTKKHKTMLNNVGKPVTKYQELIRKILEEVDPDIKEIMLAVGENEPNYENFQLLTDPANTILNWQAMRDRKKGIKQSDIDFIIKQTLKP
jgi:hypothetical protein